MLSGNNNNNKVSANSFLFLFRKNINFSLYIYNILLKSDMCRFLLGLAWQLNYMDSIKLWMKIDSKK
jgi:hypothetical protein